ncbi:MAG TPA: cellulase family glycosylhydrolase, partial [Candidatus Eisenbacteria bacterium]|nr:cellulase family glycosylhydrolase [Candidatus Eisenbacteria bacterium]
MTLRRRLLIVASIVGVLILVTCGWPGRPGATTTARTSLLGSGFHVSGNRILDPAGQPFTVKGADAVYGRFAGGDANGLGRTNYQHAERDLDALRAAGFNLVRLSISADAARLPPSSPDYIPYDQYLDELDRVVTWVTQRGM